jgi:hypothetical protein
MLHDLAMKAVTVIVQLFAHYLEACNEMIEYLPAVVKGLL